MVTWREVGCDTGHDKAGLYEEVELHHHAHSEPDAPMDVQQADKDLPNTPLRTRGEWAWFGLSSGLGSGSGQQEPTTAELRDGCVSP